MSTPPHSSPSTDGAAPLVACVNSSEAITQLLRDVLLDEGFRAVQYVSSVQGGAAEAIRFLQAVAPAAVIYTVSVPYEAGWQEFQQVRGALPDCQLVVTTTNKAALDGLAGPQLGGVGC